MSPGELDAFLESVRLGVSALAQLDSKHTLFAASAHRYSFDTVISEAELDAIERRLGFALPDDYRAFITRIGNGGAGPGYGVMGFQGGDPEDRTSYEKLAAPWAYTESYNPTDLLYADEDSAGEDELSSERYWDAFKSDGSLCLCTHGCGSYTLLVVAGPCRGQVWYDGVADDHGYYPATDASGQRHTFRSWYLEWLAESKAKLGGMG
ncbi:SMI1/KNR4 family protein [Pendulispora brunnea]|uniref:SMI1/KNR4 family protein n=1 Tax=Pendulispora brunnea TaxID=2905690 RepID=A0ABZ2KKQ3_9BACT